MKKNDFAKASENFRAKARKAKENAARINAQIDALYNAPAGGSFSTKLDAWRAAKDEHGAELDALHEQYAAELTAESRLTLCARISDEMELRTAANQILEALKAAPVKVSTLPTHYKKFTDLLDSITPEGFRAYVSHKYHTWVEIVVYRASGFSSNSVELSIMTDTPGTMTAEEIQGAKPFEIIEAGDILRTVKDAEKKHAAILRKIDALNAEIRATYDSIPEVEMLQERFPYSIGTTETRQRYFY